MKQRTIFKLTLYAVLVLVCATFATWFQHSNFGDWIEQRAYDLRFRARGPLPPLSEPGIVILSVDEETFSRIDEPLIFWQRHFAAVFDGMILAGADVVGVDFLFPEVVSRYDPEGQTAMMQSILRARVAELPIILAYRARGEEVDQPAPLLLMAAGPEGFAFINLTTDSDDFVRRQELFSEQEDGEAALGFAYAIAVASRQSSPEILEKVRTSLGPTILIRYRSRSPFPEIPFWRALEAVEQNDEAFLQEKFQDRIVLIGVMGDEDLHSTPLYYWPLEHPLNEFRRTPGIEIHGNTISTILEGRFIQRIGPGGGLLVALALILAVSALCFKLAPLKALIGAVALLSAYLLAAIFWAFPQGWWLDVVSPVVGVFLAAGGSQTINYFVEGREKLRLRGLFQRYVSGKVIAQILEAPEDLILSGEVKPVTVLFSDIRDFTTRSEGMSPSDLVDSLNEYLAAMVQAIHARQGMIDKFMGDGIMAIFGAPLRDENAAENAVRAAQDMLAELDRLNRRIEQRGQEPIRIGIGIHSGEAVVGNIGSPERMEYTAIGDVVNVASRIEGLNKKFNSEILISEDTYRSIRDTVQTEFLGKESVKGRSRPIAIHKVLGDSEVPAAVSPLAQNASGSI